MIVVWVVDVAVTMRRYEGEQLALVDDALAVVAAGEPLPESMVCADPDDVVRGLVEDPRSWPIESYEVLGLSDLTWLSTTSLSQWYVDILVDGEQWLVEFWDADAGRMAGICGISAHPVR